MTIPAHGSPCTLCGVRPDVACRHRPADETYHPPVQEEVRKRDTSKSSSGEFRQLSGMRSFTMAKTGKMMRIKGRGD